MRDSRIPCVIIRGGTSKGLFFHERDLPPDPRARDALLLSIFGSPDPRQIDGLGGADPLTSKLAILRPSERLDADVDYTFGQVSLDEPLIDYSLNCGNISSGAAIFAIDEGLVTAEAPITTVRIFNTNTSTYLRARVPVEHGRAATTGDFRIDGVPGTGAMIHLTFLHTAGATTGKLLPTGNAMDRVLLPTGKRIDLSIVDAGNLYAFAAADALGLRGDESPTEIDKNGDVIGLAQEILRACSALINESLCRDQPITVKKLGLVSRVVGNQSPARVGFASRILSSSGRVHKAFAVTGAICAGSAAFIQGSVVHRLLDEAPGKTITIAHPQGTIDVDIECERDQGVTWPVAATLQRTARRLMDGYVYTTKGRGL